MRLDNLMFIYIRKKNVHIAFNQSHVTACQFKDYKLHELWNLIILLILIMNILIYYWNDCHCQNI